MCGSGNPTCPNFLPPILKLFIEKSMFCFSFTLLLYFAYLYNSLKNMKTMHNKLYCIGLAYLLTYRIDVKPSNSASKDAFAQLS